MPRPFIDLTSAPVLDAIMGNLPVGLLVVLAQDLEVVAANEQACRFLGHPRSELEGKRIPAIIRDLDMTLISPGGELAVVSQIPIVRACTTGEVVRGEH